MISGPVCVCYAERLPWLLQGPGVVGLEMEISPLIQQPPAPVTPEGEWQQEAPTQSVLQGVRSMFSVFITQHNQKGCG